MLTLIYENAKFSEIIDSLQLMTLGFHLLNAGVISNEQCYVISYEQWCVISNEQCCAIRTEQCCDPY